MRIAVTGTHQVGKTTLAEAIADALSGHDLVEEPYHDMAADGHVFLHPPTVEDFEDQLEHALLAMTEDRADVVFDRCALDLMAYLLVAAPDHQGVFAEWGERVRRAMRSLELVVFVPIKDPDRVGVAGGELADYRPAVNEHLRDFLFGDRLSLPLEVLEVHGSPRQRVGMVLARIEALSHA